MVLFEYDFPIDELEFEIIYSCLSRHIDESISWYIDVLDVARSFEFELSDIVPCFHILESLGVRLEYPDTIPVQYVDI